ncbi:DUF2530 domain-containing protein [Saccharothrix variisporea]|uniref:Uncharacterized protein DUF2530 n=1 Tax=Saccharothrix variisporea TaxID=543527 RepID=A0A495XD26_9PSEU|nr:DUF2530 domain-containing protein [Saccharothrix variisporea]RKT71015.1 uncharacterized protein DUF2530 [Saccharothrix variisporea]
MAEQTQSPPAPPPLPPRLTDPVPAIAGGTALWLLAFAAVLLFARDQTTLLWTCAAGAGLGVIGYGIFRWQRSAARRGSRTAQSGLD